MTLIEYRCSVEKDGTIRFQHCKGLNALKISFRRTIRVPDNGKANYLPPDAGLFPLSKVKDYKDKLPASMVAKGGLFLPMYQQEAMWIHLEATEPFMIKIYCGGVNVVSGEYANEDMATKLRRQTLRAQKASLQDYFVVPGQRWVDGIAAKPGYVKQFVAMPLGKGYSIEAQLTGKETTAGLQFEITPAAQIRYPVQYNVAKHVMPKTPMKNAKNAKNASTLQIKVLILTLTGKKMEIWVRESTAIGTLKSIIQEKEGVPTDHQRLIFQGLLLDDSRTLHESNIQHNSTLHMILRLRGGGSPSWKGAEMGIAAGGLIEQTIVEDRHPQYTWDPKLTTTFNVQILNSAAFKRITGSAPPKTPITAEMYASNNMPFFEMWEEPSTIHGAFENVKSVAEIDGVKEPAQRFPLVHLSANRSAISATNIETEAESNKFIDDPDGIVNKAGPFREHRTIHDLAKEIDNVSFASFDSDEEMA